MGVKRRKGLCKYKTSKGNVYPDYISAKKAAIGISGKFNLKQYGMRAGIQTYFCEFCGKWHLGRRRDKRRRFQFYAVPYSIIQYLDQWLNKEGEH